MPFTKSNAALHGRKGGLVTVACHGRGHMAAIGKVGFARLATFANGGRRAALARLSAKGKIVPRHVRPDWEYDAAAAELYRQFDLD